MHSLKIFVYKKWKLKSKMSAHKTGTAAYKITG